MEKRVFAAIFLSFLVLVVYQNYFAPPVPAPAATPAPTPLPGSPAPAITPGPATSPAAPAPGAAPGAIAPTAPPAIETVAPEARDVVVETDAVRAVFTTQGAVLKSWKLRQYLDARGEPLELVPQDLPPGQLPRPFAITTGDATFNAILASAVYEPSVESLRLGTQPGTITFQFKNDAGLTARKAFYFQPNGQPYVLNLDASVDQGGTPRPVTIAFGAAIGLGYDPSGATRWPEKAIHHLNGSVERLDADDLRAQPRYEGAMRFAGVEEHYFLIAAVPAQVPQSRVEYAPITLPVPGAPAGAQRTFITFAITPNPASASGQPVTLPFFLGPKDFDQLKMADTQLVRAIDFGMFSAIVVPLLRALKWINGFLGNYGWSIIALTVIINLLLFPLRHRSMVSMKKMQAIQPEVKAIQDRYAKYKFNDPERQKMNAEMLALYKQKGVNPVAGCLPMALTFPILLALYSLLSVAIELRGAPFIGWIHDLASKDPTYVWPILMGATMFWQQKMMPTNADPIQQKIFLLLPVIFTVMFLSMPSGLVIYWLTSNLLTIAQQYATNRLVAAPVRASAAAARKG
jgi:YidC/Oxa1 family membrane protein insertase